jgi:putative tryptophan/tyrosine transport system substrate-binding protein
MFFTLSAMLFALCVSAEAQQTGKIPRIGFLEPSGSSIASPRLQAFREGLRELGYVEGKTFAIEYRSAEEKPDRLTELAAELVRLKVDVIFALGTQAIAAAKTATQTIPVVMSGGDPVGTGLVASLARPGGNITGLSNFSPDLAGKRLELLKEVVPRLSRIAALWNPENQLAAFKETQAAAGPLGIQLQSVEVRSANEIENAFQAAAKGRAGAVTVMLSASLFSQRRRTAELAVMHKLPTMHSQSLWVEAGGLMSYGTYFPDLWRRAATYVDKILKGAKPADLPVEQPMKFEFVINLKAAKQIGVTIPPNVLARADRVIK